MAAMEVFLIFPKSQQAKQELLKELAEKCTEAALLHGAEAGTGRCNDEALEGTEVIHTQIALIYSFVS